MPILVCLGLPFLLLAEEAGVFLLPGDISLVGTGVVAGHTGISPFLSWILAGMAMVIGSSILFGLSRRHHFARAVVPVGICSRVEQHGAWGIGCGRLLPGLRNGTVVAAAASRVPFRSFLTGVIPTALLWSGLLLGLGYFGGPRLFSVYVMIEHSLLLRVVSLVLMASVVAFIAMRVVRHNRAKRA